ncbi:MAG: type II toxin-antitoxin system VapC family toxin [Verrucomicrobiota bacterium]
MECVVDLSYSAGWFQPSQQHPAATHLLKAHLDGEVTVICPSIWIYEVINLLLNAVRRRTLSETQADDGFELLSAIDARIEEQHTHIITRRILRLGRQFGLSAYDAAYLELADRLQLPLLTRDEELLTAAKQRHLPITLNL